MKIYEIVSAKDMKQGKENRKDASSSVYHDIDIKLGTKNKKDPRPDSNYGSKKSYYSGANKPRKLSKADADLIWKYVHNDAPPIGKIGAAIERFIKLSEPINHSLVSYRGMMVDAKITKAIVKQIDKKKTYVFQHKNPMSFSNSQSVAWDFVSPTRGYRMQADKNRMSVVMEVMIPAGTQIARFGLSVGVGAEHMISKNSKIEFFKWRKYRGGIIITGKVV